MLPGASSNPAHRGQQQPLPGSASVGRRQWCNVCRGCNYLAQTGMFNHPGGENGPGTSEMIDLLAPDYVDYAAKPSDTGASQPEFVDGPSIK